METGPTIRIIAKRRRGSEGTSTVSTLLFPSPQLETRGLKLLIECWINEERKAVLPW